MSFHRYFLVSQVMLGTYRNLGPANDLRSENSVLETGAMGHLARTKFCLLIYRINDFKRNSASDILG